jgi:uncharacterized protein (TIGR04255 family)
MMTSIDLAETFPHLSKAPIVEAVIEMRVVPSVKWDEISLQSDLKQRLPDFPKVETLREARVQIALPGKPGSRIALPRKPGSPTFEDFGCVGLKLHSNDNLHIVQFNKGAFVFSRLQPYENWEQLSGEALRLWAIYFELLKPREVIRIGLRFINCIYIMQAKVELSDYYRHPPDSLKELDWPLAGYLHHDVIQVPQTQHSVNLIKTVQNIPGKIGLILDIDVFMGTRFDYNESCLKRFLEEMRWVKNKIFFNSLTENIIEELK